LAKLLKAGIRPGADGVPPGMEPFNYAHKGNLAYIGAPSVTPGYNKAALSRASAVMLSSTWALAMPREGTKRHLRRWPAAQRLKTRVDVVLQVATAPCWTSRALGRSR